MSGALFLHCFLDLLIVKPIHRLNDEARRLFEELGSTAAKELSFRDSWVFVGAKGIENKSPFEQVGFMGRNMQIFVCKLRSILKISFMG